MQNSDEPKDVKASLDSIVERVMDGLTPFQRATVKKIDQLYGEGRLRILVADEVGLGKTIVAKGVVAKIAKRRLEENDDLVKVVYICSNGAIADQNLRKLQIDSEVRLERGSTTRLSMQHAKLAEERIYADDLHRRYIQMIPLTPETSFRLENSTGNQAERALMFAVLEYDPAISRRIKIRLKNLLWSNHASDRSKDAWNAQISNAQQRVYEIYKAGVEFDGLAGIYPYNVLDLVKRELANEEYDFSRIVSYLDETPSRKFENKIERAIIVSLRRAFSKTSIDLMDPDFVIMDEFQRFHNLVADNKSEMSLLANRFFAGQIDDEGARHQARVLLLSATPFRMYSTQDEDDDEDFGSSNREFNDVISFLSEQNKEELGEFKRVWTDYSKDLYALETKGIDVLATCLSKKEAAQKGLGKYIVRTERVSTDELSNLISSAVNPEPLEISEEDISFYFAMRQIAEATTKGASYLTPDYAKSCPYAFSFMNRYKAKQAIDAGAKEDWDRANEAVRRYKKALWLNADDIDSYRRLNVGHARYRKLRDDVFDYGASDGKASRVSQLLWVPPSIPYYRPSKDSAFSVNKDFTKTLVFSSWAMVPPALSSLLSYEAEQENVRLLSAREGNRDSYRYFKNAVEEEVVDEESDTTVLPHNRLSLSGKRANSFLLVYPSSYLVKAVDFSKVAQERSSLSDLKQKIAREIKQDFLNMLGINKIPARAGRERVEWYDIAVLLLDAYGDGYSMLDMEHATVPLLEICSQEDGSRDFSDASSALRALAEKYAQFDLEQSLSSVPDDLFETLAEAAIASPAVCALRSYASLEEIDARPLAFEFGYSFMTKMNTADATLCVAVAMERGRSIPSAHWKRLLAYCCEGNFQSMLDEYVHLVYEGNLKAAHEQIIGGRIGIDKSPSLHKAETRVQVETFDSFEAKAKVGEDESNVTRRMMRCAFAAGFMEDVGKRASGENRRAELRAAFNSPFRPFVLISTSVGQEGLDFHQYCRRIVHWNLPSSPIDFEQREGRINRYKSLAVRKSLANRYGDDAAGSKDVWGELFSIAVEKENAGSKFGDTGSGLLPFWGVRDGEGKVPIERIVYNYPFSRDESLYEYLLYTMVNYRAVLGQPNQEELLSMLQRKFDTDFNGNELRELFVNLCPIALTTLDNTQD